MGWRDWGNVVGATACGLAWCWMLDIRPDVTATGVGAWGYAIVCAVNRKNRSQRED